MATFLAHRHRFPSTSPRNSRIIHVMFRSVLVFVFAAFSPSLFADPLPSDFSKRYTGTLSDSRTVTLLLERHGEDLSGSLLYPDQQVPVLGKMKEDETFTLRETRYSQDGNQTITGYWNGTLTAQGLIGLWKRTEKETGTDVRLQEQYGEGCVALQVVPLASTWKRKRGEQELGAEIDCRYLQITSPRPADKRINDRLRYLAWRMLQQDNRKTSDAIPTTADLEAMVWKASQVDVEWEFAYVADLSYTMSVAHNDQHLLCIRLASYEYTGGAHGNSTARFVVFDLKSGDELPLSRVLKAGYEKDFLAAARADLLAQAGAKPGDSLVEAGMFEDKLELNGNWSVTKDGIAFSYDPYEIASYARGFVEFTVPWQKVRPWIKSGQPLEIFAK